MPKQLDQYRHRYLQAISVIMAEHGIETFKEVAEKIDSTNQTLSAILQKRQYPTVQHGINLCQKYGYNANWLFLGKGEPKIDRQATLDDIYQAVTKKNRIKI